MSTEANLQGYLKKIARAAGVSFYKTTAVSRTGFPDVQLIWKGHHVFVECKSPKKTGRLSPRQKLIHEEMRGQNAEIYVIDSREQADAIIGGLVRRRPTRRHKPLI